MFSNLEIICGILHLEYLKIHFKNVKTLYSKTFSIETIEIILEGRGFRGSSEEKMRKMWLGLEIVVADLPLSVRSTIRNSCLQT